MDSCMLSTSVASPCQTPRTTSVGRHEKTQTLRPTHQLAVSACAVRRGLFLLRLHSIAPPSVVSVVDALWGEQGACRMGCSLLLRQLWLLLWKNFVLQVCYRPIMPYTCKIALAVARWTKAGISQSSVHCVLSYADSSSNRDCVWAAYSSIGTVGTGWNKVWHQTLLCLRLWTVDV